MIIYEEIFRDFQKQKAGRPIDRLDIAELKEIKRLRGKK